MSNKLPKALKDEGHALILARLIHPSVTFLTFHSFIDRRLISSFVRQSRSHIRSSLFLHINILSPRFLQSLIWEQLRRSPSLSFIFTEGWWPESQEDCRGRGEVSQEL